MMFEVKKIFFLHDSDVYSPCKGKECACVVRSRHRPNVLLKVFVGRYQRGEDIRQKLQIQDFVPYDS